jgi:hypothetical protein
VLRFGDPAGAPFAIVATILGIALFTLCNQISWTLIILMLHVVLIISFHLCWHLSFIWLVIKVLTLLVKKVVILNRGLWLLFLLSFLELLEASLRASRFWRRLVISIELLLLLRGSWRLWVVWERDKTGALSTQASLVVSDLLKRLLYL